MNFDLWKRRVFRLAKKAKVGHLVPNSDALFGLYERGWTAEAVVQTYCTKEAQAERHGEIT